jgi:hypothetical protein
VLVLILSVLVPTLRALPATRGGPIASTLVGSTLVRRPGAPATPTATSGTGAVVCRRLVTCRVRVVGFARPSGRVVVGVVVGLVGVVVALDRRLVLIGLVGVALGLVVAHQGQDLTDDVGLLGPGRHLAAERFDDGDQFGAVLSFEQ